MMTSARAGARAATRRTCAASAWTRAGCPAATGAYWRVGPYPWRASEPERTGRPAVAVLVVIALGRSERNLAMTWLRSLSPLLVVLLPSAAWAQEVASGPEKDTKVPALKVF